VLASAAGLFGLGAATTVLTGRSVLLAGSRQDLVGAAAATLTYVLGPIWALRWAVEERIVFIHPTS
jgi:VIT1/CCC1 family predicted Fe2+/Mn2+ transporter